MPFRIPTKQRRENDGEYYNGSCKKRRCVPKEDKHYHCPETLNLKEPLNGDQDSTADLEPSKTKSPYFATNGSSMTNCTVNEMINAIAPGTDAPYANNQELRFSPITTGVLMGSNNYGENEHETTTEQNATCDGDPFVHHGRLTPGTDTTNGERTVHLVSRQKLNDTSRHHGSRAELCMGRAFGTKAQQWCHNSSNPPSSNFYSDQLHVGMTGQTEEIGKDERPSLTLTCNSRPSMPEEKFGDDDNNPIQTKQSTAFAELEHNYELGRPHSQTRHDQHGDLATDVNVDIVTQDAIHDSYLDSCDESCFAVWEKYV
jgi:hypothetical protein